MPVDPRYLEVNERPMQRSALSPTLLRETHLPPRGHVLDVRWVVSVAELEHLLQVARASQTGRAVIHHASLRSSLWLDPSGHMFETYAMVGADPRPERVLDPAQVRGESVGGGTVG